METGSLHWLLVCLYYGWWHYPTSITALLPNTLPCPWIRHIFKIVWVEEIAQAFRLPQFPMQQDVASVYGSQDCLAAFRTFSSPHIFWFILKNFRAPKWPHQQCFWQSFTVRKSNLGEHFPKSRFSKEHFLLQAKSWNQTQQLLQSDNGKWQITGKSRRKTITPWGKR